MNLGMIAGTRKVIFSIQNARGEPEPRLRGGLRAHGFMLGSFSDRSRIVSDVATVFANSRRFWKVLFRGRRSIS